MPIPTSPFSRYRASQLVLSNNDPISTWSDEGSGGNDLTGTGTARPIYESAGFNDHPSVLFDGTNDLMQTTYGVAISQPNTIAVLGEMTDVPNTNAHFLFDGVSGGRHALINDSNLANDPLVIFAGGSARVSTLSLVGTEGTDVCIVNIFNDPANSTRLSINDGTPFTANSPGPDNLSGLTLASRFSAEEFIGMRLVEVLVYDRALTIQEITDLQDYFVSTYISADQELDVPFFQQINSIFPITVQNQSAQELNVPHHGSEVQIFAPVVENQNAQELNVPHHPSEVQIFAPTLTTGDNNLEIPFLQNTASLFAPVVENQTAQELNVGFIDSTAQLFVITADNQTDSELNVPFFQNVALLFTPIVFNEGEELFEPTLVGNGTLADRIMAGLIDQGFLAGTIVDREYARLLAKLSLTAPQPKSLDDLYSMAGEENRILGIGIDELSPA